MEPFGERGAYARSASLMATLCNLRRRKSSDPIVKVEDFMPETLKAPAQPVDPREAFLALAHGIGGKRLKVVTRNG